MVIPLVNSKVDVYERRDDVQHLSKALNLDLDCIANLAWLEKHVAIELCEFVLFDHNTPESIIKQVCGQQAVRVVKIVDHHAIADADLVAAVKNKVIEPSCSCCSVLLRHASKETLEEVSKTVPAALQAACIVMAYDAFNFPPAEKGVRYWQFDLDCLEQ